MRTVVHGEKEYPIGPSEAPGLGAGDQHGMRDAARRALQALFLSALAVAEFLFAPVPRLQAQSTAVCDCPTCGTPRVYTTTPGFRLMCSATWQMTSTCGGPTVDQVDKWSITGAIPQSGWNIRPWSSHPITFIGVELTKMVGPQHLWWMVGNNVVPDVMVFMTRSEDHVKQFYPTGFGMPFPALDAALPKDYIDLHGTCASAGEQVQLFLTLYYAP